MIPIALLTGPRATRRDGASRPPHSAVPAEHGRHGPLHDALERNLRRRHRPVRPSMRRWAIAQSCAAPSPPARPARRHGALHPRRAHDSPAPSPPVGHAPAAAAASIVDAADAIFGADAMAPVRARLCAEHGGPFGYARSSRSLARVGLGGYTYSWDGEARFGGDIVQLVIKNGGEGAFGGAFDRGEGQLLWGHAIGPVRSQTGLRQDVGPGPLAHLCRCRRPKDSPLLVRRRSGAVPCRTRAMSPPVSKGATTSASPSA